MPATKKQPAPSQPTEPKKEWHLPSWTNNALVVLLIGSVIAGWIRLDSRISALEVDMAKVKQDFADGGGHALASLLEKSTSPQQAAASMTLARAQVQLDVAKGKKTNPKLVSALAPALTATAKKYPDLPVTWETVSTIANYRTASLQIEQSESLPDCDAAHAKLQLLYRQDYPQFNIPGPAVDVLAYLFQNCVLHLSHLPGHSIPLNIKMPDGPRAGEFVPAHMGSPAFAENCVIVLDDEGISDTDILWIETRNCKFDFNVNRTPAKREQQLLLASLEGSTSENARLPVNGGGAG